MSGPALVAVAHGSRDPRSAATITALVAEVRRQAPDLDVRVSFLDLSAPRLGDVLDGVAADGHRHAVVVPLLLGNAFHARSDVPGMVSAAAARNPFLRIDTSDVLGPDPGTDAAALSRLRDALSAATDPHLAEHPPASQAPHGLRGPGNSCEDEPWRHVGPDVAGRSTTTQGMRDPRGPGIPREDAGDRGAAEPARNHPHLADGSPASHTLPGLRGPGMPCEVDARRCGDPHDADGSPTSQALHGVHGPGFACEDPLCDPELGVVLASVGSSRAAANQVVADRVAGWRDRFGWVAASAAYVTAAEPTPAQAIEAVRAAGARRVAVVPWMLAPGRLPDRIDAAAAEGGALVADPIGPHPDLAAAVLRQWATAVEPGSAARRVG